jgi:mRNA-degrading endonuclease toxin of MazEF toxin-antitoxin module
MNPTEGREQRGEARPCLVVHRDSLRRAGTAIVVPLTTKAPRAGFPLTVHLPTGTGGNDVESWAKVTQIRVVAETRILRPAIASLTEAELEPVKKALRLVLDL